MGTSANPVPPRATLPGGVGPEVPIAPVAAETRGVTRRAVLVGAGAATLGVAAVGVLAACSPSSSGGSGGGGGGGAAGGALAQLKDIPVGGAVSAQIDGKPVLLVQPTAGTVVGLTAICTHQGCTVAPGKGELDCPCHGSVYALDGSVRQGPASAPLATVDVHVANGAVLAGKA